MDVLYKEATETSRLENFNKTKNEHETITKDVIKIKFCKS